MLRTFIDWTGFPGAPGRTTLHWDSPSTQAGADAAAQATDTFAASLIGNMPPVVTLHVPGEVYVVDVATGIVSTAFSELPGFGYHVGSGPANYAAPVGAVLDLITSTFREGRRMKGRIFVVPLCAAVYNNQGALYANTQSALSAAVGALASDPANLLVYGRPGTKPRKNRPPLGAGVAARVSAVHVPSETVVLRSRRN